MRWVNYYEQFNCFFFTSRVVNQIELLKPHILKSVFIERLNFYQKYYTISIHGYVIMDNHFHLLFSNLDGKADQTRKFVQNLLRTTSKLFIQILQMGITNEFSNSEVKEYIKIFNNQTRSGMGFRVWKERARGVPVWNEKIFKEKLDYIHNNPVRAGMVKNAEDYLFSSARDWILGKQGFVKIIPFSGF